MNYSELVTAVQDYCENTFPTVDMNVMIRNAEQNIYNTVQLASLRKNMTGSLSTGNQYLSAPDDFLSVYSLAVIKANGEYLYLLNKDVNFIREAYPNPGTSTVSARGLPKHYAIFGPNSVNTNELSFILGPTPDQAYAVELHFYYLPDSIVQSALSALNSSSFLGGSGYANGAYFNVPLTGGSGNSATANIVVSGGAVTSVIISNPGCLYSVGNLLSASNANLGGTGSGFSIPVLQVTTPTGTTWLGDNFDSALFNGTMVEAIRYMKGDTDIVQFYQQQFTQSLALLKNLGDGKQRMDAYRDGQVRNPVM
jgi:hypothetical protein